MTKTYESLAKEYAAIMGPCVRIEQFLEAAFRAGYERALKDIRESEEKSKSKEARSMNEDDTISLEERVEALSQYMDEAQGRILELEGFMKVFADCLKDVLLLLGPSELPEEDNA